MCLARLTCDTRRRCATARIGTCCSKSIFFRSVKIRRLYDTHSNALIYVSYSDRLTVNEEESMDKNKYGTSIAVVPLGRQRPPGA